MPSILPRNWPQCSPGRQSFACWIRINPNGSPAVVGLIKIACAIGERVQITDPVAAQRRDDALRASNTGVKARRSPPFPPLGEGLVRAAGSPGSHETDGKPSIQGRVVFNGTVNRLDQFLKSGWSILSRHPVPPALFNARQQWVLSCLDIQIAHISRASGPHYVDLDADYDMWFKATGKKVFVVRPDTYIFGSARTVDDLPALIDTLADALAAHGWLGIQAGR